MRFEPAIAWLLAVGIALPAPAATLTARGDVIELRGQIEPGDGARFVALATPDLRTLRIRSGGGSLLDGLAIGRAVRDRGLEVEIDGLCASACAQLILPAARRVRASDGALVLMHGFQDGALRAARREGRMPDEPSLAEAFATLATLQSEMDEFLASTGLRPEGLAFMYALTSTSDVTVSVSPQPTGGMSLRVTGRDPICRAWLLGPDTLRDLGVRADAWKPGGRWKAAFMTGERVDEIYDGTPAEIVPDDRSHDCRHFSARVRR